MITVGVTGGIGSGKTHVCRHFEDLGIPVYYADDRAKRIMHRSDIVTSVSTLLGESAYVDGQLQRAYVAQKVFADKSLLQALNAIVHPAVGKDFITWCAQHQSDVVVKEAALLVENQSYKNLHYLLVVDAPLEQRIARVMQRDGVARAQVEARIAAQLPTHKKVEVADFVIENANGTDVLPQVERVLMQIRHLG